MKISVIKGGDVIEIEGDEVKYREMVSIHGEANVIAEGVVTTDSDSAASDSEVLPPPAADPVPDAAPEEVPPPDEVPPVEPVV
jgi:hypothetical protein